MMQNEMFELDGSKCSFNRIFRKGGGLPLHWRDFFDVWQVFPDSSRHLETGILQLNDSLAWCTIYIYILHIYSCSLDFASKRHKDSIGQSRIPWAFFRQPMGGNHKFTVFVLVLLFCRKVPGVNTLV